MSRATRTETVQRPFDVAVCDGCGKEERLDRPSMQEHPLRRWYRVAHSSAEVALADICEPCALKLFPQRAAALKTEAHSPKTVAPQPSHDREAVP